MTDFAGEAERVRIKKKKTRPAAARRLPSLRLSPRETAGRERGCVKNCGENLAARRAHVRNISRLGPRGER